ncbi:hypothetical protein BZG36_04325 [Bifiguratus adelaidae]|uniref:CENP-V/GFA domain-containing protein n=1 Tax=Bifiguratus adelaidae TaxID=1938954 RepID=A0A261XUZ7_9FUNG|nr:hypothetical protein BZG36_04325 [Bifiguratus adelaidae]
MEGLVHHRGACHCGQNRFECFTPSAELTVTRCNCSICHMRGAPFVQVPVDRFKQLTPQSNLLIYTFNTHTAQHYFCKTCGITPFYRPRSHPDGYSINLHCLDPSTIQSTRLMHFDGQHWEGSVEAFKASTLDDQRV